MQTVRTVLCAVDLSEAAREVLSQAHAFSDQLGARLRLVHVVHDLDRYMGFYVGTRSLPDLQESLEREARERLRRLVDDVLGAPDAVEFEIVKGTPYSDLVAHAVAVGADLLVVGAHGTSKPEHKLFGSVAERLCRHAPCPVLVVGQRP